MLFGKKRENVCYVMRGMSRTAAMSMAVSMTMAMVLFLFTTYGGAAPATIEPVDDVAYQQATSVKFVVSPKVAGAKFKKVVVDYRNNVYVLSDQGLLRDFTGPDFVGTSLAKDYSYASLVNLQPVDITVQEKEGYLYYLYDDRFLTNAHAGTIGEKFPAGSYQTIRVNESGDVLLVGEAGCAIFRGGEKIGEFSAPAESAQEIAVSGSSFYWLTSDALFCLEGTGWNRIFTGSHLTCMTTLAEKIYLGTTNGYCSITRDGTLVEPLFDRLPVPSIRKMAAVADTLWFITDDGAFCRNAEGFRYFASKRWLDQDKVLDLAADDAGNLYFLTETGLNKIEYLSLTLAEKAKRIQTNLLRYHIRFGWSVAANFVDPTDPTTLSLRDNDNDGLWTSFWLGSQAFRYAVTGEEEARRNVWESFEAFERNLTIHPLEGFSARTFERKGFAGGPEWRDAPEEDWVWKGTTSTDEVVGYIFIADVIDRFVAQTPDEKKRVADYIDAMLQHIIRNDYYMIDHDGEPTLWARWNAEYVNSFAETQFDRRLNSVLITAMLQLGYRLTGNEFYRSELFRIWKEWGFRKNMMIPMENVKFTEGFQHMGITMGEDWNHSDDEMAFLTYYVLYNTMFDDSYRADYTWIVNDHWEIERPEKNALWNVIPYSLTGAIDRDATLWWLREFNLDRKNWRVKNSHRQDIELLTRDIHENFRAQRTRELLPQGEILTQRHNSNGFNINGGHDYGEQITGEEFLLPYWMCRYYGVIR